MAHALAQDMDDRDAAASAATIAYYDGAAADYADATLSNDLTALYPSLLDQLPQGALVLDAGSGSGRDILAFQRRGFRVEALDASAELARIATKRTGVAVEVARLEDWRAPAERYDGIWCFASLLHVARAQLPEVIRTLAGALKVGGWLFASFKQGATDQVDGFGRYYTNVRVEDADALFSMHGLRVARIWCDEGPALSGRTTWVYVLANRAG